MGDESCGGRMSDNKAPVRIHVGYDICDAPYWICLPGETKGRKTEPYISEAALLELVERWEKECADYWANRQPRSNYRDMSMQMLRWCAGQLRGLLEADK